MKIEKNQSNKSKEAILEEIAFKIKLLTPNQWEKFIELATPILKSATISDK